MEYLIDFLLIILGPFIYLGGLIGLPKKKFTGVEYYKFRDMIHIGDTLLTKTRYEFSNLYNPAKLKHGAIYVGRILGGDVCYVLESTRKGVVLTDLVTFLTHTDYVVCSRLKAFQIETLEVLWAAAHRFKGTPYDYRFSTTGKRFYCFETVVECYKAVIPHINFKVKTFLGSKKIYDHNTFLDPEMFTIVFDTRTVK